MMRVLTVRQPWAWAIIHGGKDVENRVRNLAGAYRGPIAIHAGLADYEQGNLGSRAHRAAHDTETDTRINFGAIIGVVELIGVHHWNRANASPCCDMIEGWGGTVLSEVGGCSSWAERGVWHLELANPRALRDPIPYRGALHLQTASVDLENLIVRSVS